MNSWICISFNCTLKIWLHDCWTNKMFNFYLLEESLVKMWANGPRSIPRLCFHVERRLDSFSLWSEEKMWERIINASSILYLMVNPVRGHTEERSVLFIQVKSSEGWILARDHHRVLTYNFVHFISHLLNISYNGAYSSVKCWNERELLIPVKVTLHWGRWSILI